MKIARLLLFLLALHFTGTSYARQDSTCRLRISLLTCSPGEELYSAFGHTAIRVVDSTLGTDIVYNYGTFDDSDPDFYLKFTKGLMLYALSAYPFADFVREYQYYQRGVIEQTLQLSCAQALQLAAALRKNNMPENRFYNYYFHTDNCTTRARDMIAQQSGAGISFNNILGATAPTYRELIHSYLDKGGQYWSKFGIDILLGANLDKTVSNQEAMFLPDYLLKGVDSAFVENAPLVASKQVILPETPLDQSAKTLLTPLTFFAGLLVLIGGLSLLPSKGVRKLLTAFDIFFFLSLGILGILLLSLWIVRVDDVCRNNLNLLWALPTHLPLAFILWSRKEWIRRYFRFVFFFTLLVTVCWFFLPQQLNLAVAPILGLILVRSWYRTKA
ncbi:MAG: DUF4105 domain-containing protein [Candidatus Pseudobacter hemicellulosilyticus]|uniref:DUF4105 domain-containing protein n=1 Tax=Candidatus Pseudobacter hemicellulosilyticus TaxID=3121375 RepID=A0AAJ5WTE8_9BACT|nr:MAG: DUF4105 domain-containing protein [Pseudobacter sp.]